MSDIINLIIIALATYGFSTLVSSYDGPARVFLKLRSRFPNSAVVCAVCTSVWVSVPLTYLVTLGLVWFVTPLAIVGAVIILEKL